MAGPDTSPPHRRFVTRADVENASRTGEDIALGPLDVITHEASARAADLGVTVQRPNRPEPRRWTQVAPRPSVVEPIETPGRPAGSFSRGPADIDNDDLRAAVRAAIVAELGSAPPGLDPAIDRVLARRRD